MESNDILSLVSILITVLFSSGAIVWRVSVILANLKKSFQAELKFVEEKLISIDKEVSRISIETKFVREDHDNLVILSEHIKFAKEDINAQHNKLRDVNNLVTEVLSNIGKR